MRVDNVSPRMALLAALAGWAVIAWLLTVFGMGGRISPLPEDTSLLQPLPKPRPSPQERLGTAERYDTIASRPLFSEDRRPQPFSLGGGDAEEDDGFEYVLTSVIIAPSLEMAILQPSEGEGEPIRVKLGEASPQASAYRLVSLEPRRAVFEGPDGEMALDLRAFDGTGGAPATPTAVATPRTQRGAAGTQRGDAKNAAEGAATQAADAAAKAAGEAAKTAASKAAQPPAPPTQPSAQSPEPAVTTPDEQIEAIRKRIQERRAQLRREAEEQPQGNNP